MKDSGVHGYPGGETMADVLSRVAPAIEGLMAEHPGQAIAAVGHNVVNKAGEMADFLSAITRDSGLTTAIERPSGEGMSVSVKLPK